MGNRTNIFLFNFIRSSLHSCNNKRYTYILSRYSDVVIGNIVFKDMISAVGAVQAHIKSISCDTERSK